MEQGVYSLQTNINLKHLSQDKLKKLVEFYKADNPQQTARFSTNAP